MLAPTGDPRAHPTDAALSEEDLDEDPPAYEPEPSVLKPLNTNADGRRLVTALHTVLASTDDPAVVLVSATQALQGADLRDLFYRYLLVRPLLSKLQGDLLSKFDSGSLCVALREQSTPECAQLVVTPETVELHQEHPHVMRIVQPRLRTGIELVLVNAHIAMARICLARWQHHRVSAAWRFHDRRDQARERALTDMLREPKTCTLPLLTMLTPAPYRVPALPAPKAVACWSYWPEVISCWLAGTVARRQVSNDAAAGCAVAQTVLNELQRHSGWTWQTVALVLHLCGQPGWTDFNEFSRALQP